MTGKWAIQISLCISNKVLQRRTKFYHSPSFLLTMWPCFIQILSLRVHQCQNNLSWTSQRVESLSSEISGCHQTNVKKLQALFAKSQYVASFYYHDGQEMISLILGRDDPTRSLYGSSAVRPKTSYGITYISPSRKACMYRGSQVRTCTKC